MDNISVEKLDKVQSYFEDKTEALYVLLRGSGRFLRNPAWDKAAGHGLYDYAAPVPGEYKPF